MEMTRYKLNPQQQKMLENNLLEDEKVLKVGDKSNFKSLFKIRKFLYILLFFIVLYNVPFTVLLSFYSDSKTISPYQFHLILGFSVYFFVIPSLVLLRLTIMAYRFSFNYVITNKRLVSISPGFFFFFFLKL